MSLFRKLFQKSESHQQSSSKEEEEDSKYMPDQEVPLDERFTQNFISKGGKKEWSIYFFSKIKVISFKKVFEIII